MNSSVLISIIFGALFVFGGVAVGSLYVSQENYKENTTHVLNQLKEQNELLLKKVASNENEKNISIQEENKPVVVVENTETTESSSTSEPVKDENSVEWKQYSNKNYKLAFTYPNTFRITEEKTVAEFKDAQGNPTETWYRVRLEDNSNPKAEISIEINPDGFGPFFPNKTFTLSDTNGKATLEKVESFEPLVENSNYTTYLANAEAKNGFRYFAHFSVAKETEEYYESFKKLLESIQFLK